MTAGLQKLIGTYWLIPVITIWMVLGWTFLHWLSDFASDEAHQYRVLLGLAKLVAEIAILCKSLNLPAKAPSWLLAALIGGWYAGFSSTLVQPLETWGGERSYLGTVVNIRKVLFTSDFFEMVSFGLTYVSRGILSSRSTTRCRLWRMRDYSTVS